MTPSPVRAAIAARLGNAESSQLESNFSPNLRPYHPLAPNSTAFKPRTPTGRPNPFRIRNNVRKINGGY